MTILIFLMTVTHHLPLLLPSATHITLFPNTHCVQTSSHGCQTLTIIIPLFLSSAYHHIPSRPPHSAYFLVISSKRGESTCFFFDQLKKLLKLKWTTLQFIQTFAQPWDHSLSQVHILVTGEILHPNKTRQIVITMRHNGDDLQSPVITHL